MGLLVEGKWQDRWYDTSSTGGRFVRQDSSFRGQIRADGPHPPRVDRYHLYAAWACPWAHRALLWRRLKGLHHAISVSVVSPYMLEHGWEFDEDHPDPLYGSRYLHQIYTRAKADYTGRVTVPVLWDRAHEAIVNNESSEIIRIFDTLLPGERDPSAPFAERRLAPPELIDDIDAVNAEIYDKVNNGVYKAGFATTQHAYDEAVEELFAALDALEERLSGQPWLLGDRLTEADLRLFPTLLRFDPIYHVHFKCSVKRLVDYPNLLDHTRAIYQIPGVLDTLNLLEVRQHYFGSHETINPHRIIAAEPATLDLSAPTKRDWRRG
ncbi:MAG: glutathione S-transferase family protein [Deltaproteobacteria bacterium]|nr:MAG: glutathione S-transferase family protein [Deltaproteobacteria bacterium]